MNNEMDRYLSRCLKNATARHQPPERGKERLLRAVVAPRWRSATSRRFSSVSQPPREFNTANETVYLPGIMMRGSFTLSLAWPVHIGTLINLAQ
jgi:hypothetical protein